MGENRLIIRNRLRAKMLAWPEAETTIANTVQAAGILTIEVASTLGMTERYLLEVENELQRIVSIAGNIVTVQRADHGTAAVAHAIGKVVKVWPYWGWPDLELNQNILSAFRFLHPAVWIPRTYENTLLANVREFGCPPGVRFPDGEHIYGLEIRDSAGFFRPIYNWTHKGDRVKLGFATDISRTVRLWVKGKHIELTDDGTSVENDDIIEAVLAHATGKSLEGLLANRTRYVEYSSALNDRASTPDELQRSIFYFFNQAILAKERLTRPGGGSFASTYRG